MCSGYERQLGREGGMDVYVYGDIENPDFWIFWSKNWDSK